MNKKFSDIQKKNNSMIYKTGRVVQLDARILDESLVTLFRSQLDLIRRNVQEYYHPATISNEFHRWFFNNMEIFMDYMTQILYYIVQAINGQSPGQRLMDIRYGNFNLFKGMVNYFVGIVLPATMNLFSQLLSRNSYWRRVIIDRIKMTLKLLDFLYFFYFLNRGGPVRPIEKLLKIGSIYNNKPSLAQINFSALNREIIGHSFAQLIILMSPFLTIIQQRLVKIFNKSSKKASIFNKNMTIICEECSQKAICPVRAKKEAKYNNKHGGIYCYFCYTNSSIYNGFWREKGLLSNLRQY